MSARKPLLPSEYVCRKAKEIVREKGTFHAVKYLRKYSDLSLLDAVHKVNDLMREAGQ